MLTAAAIAFAGGYVVGALPVAWVIARRRSGVDLRDRVSTGASATSTLFVAGPAAALAAGLLECAKGAVVALAAQLYSSAGWFIAVAVAGCVVGDAFPVGLRRSGRGLLPLVTALLVALPTAGLITAIAAVPAALLTSMRGRAFDSVIAISVPAGLLLGTRDWRTLAPAAIIVAAILLRQRLRRRRRHSALPGAPAWQSMVIDADLSSPARQPPGRPGGQNPRPWET